MKYKCLKVTTKKLQKLFIKLPSMIYSDDNLRDSKIEKQILNKTHPLSSEFEIFPYLVLNENKKPICRCILTYYPNDPIAYLGFFDSLDNKTAVQEMLFEIKQKAIADKKEKIVGPIDASIFINYRFKIDRFDKTYTSEPYNKEYYPKLWEHSGFKICDKYVSNQLRKVEETDNDARIEKIYNRLLNKGYIFISPTDESFDRNLSDVYDLMMDLYSDFSGYKKISKEQFLTIYSSLKHVLNYDMVKLAYKDDELQAFCICVPNYGTLTRGKLTLSKIAKIKKIKKSPTEYIVLYLGASPKALGLGVTLVQIIRNMLCQNGCTSIGALIKEGNVTGELYKDLYIDKFEYVLMEFHLPKQKENI